MAKRVTIKDVARYADTSYQTVSRVINNKPDVADETRRRVLEAIEALKYRPSMAATSRAQPKTHIVALAVSPFNEFLLYQGDPHLLRMIHGIERTLKVRNYSLLLSTIDFNTDKTIESRLLHRQLADGVIIRLSMDDDDQTTSLFFEKGYPVVVIGYTNNPNVPSVRSDDEQGAYTQTQHLLALGHRNLGVISGPRNDPITLQRQEGHRRAMAESGLDARRTCCVEGNYTVDSGYDAAQQLMQEMLELTAIVAFSDTMAIGAMHWLTKHGYSIPGDISIVGYDDISDAARQTPPLTTIRIPSVDEGARAAEVLLDLIEHRALYTRETVVPVNLVTRQSTTVPRSLSNTD
jgi:DNA-binding LacI/PurR family transcriptional regulator